MANEKVDVVIVGAGASGSVTVAVTSVPSTALLLPFRPASEIVALSAGFSATVPADVLPVSALPCVSVNDTLTVSALPSSVSLGV